MQLDTTVYRVVNGPDREVRNGSARTPVRPNADKSARQPSEVTMNEHVQTAPLFNPLDPEFIRDPYPHYQRMRNVDPVHLTPLGMFVASRHADISLVLRDKRFGKEYAERS